MPFALSEKLTALAFHVESLLKEQQVLASKKALWKFPWSLAATRVITGSVFSSTGAQEEGKGHQSHWCWRNWESSPWKGEALHTSLGRSCWEPYIGETRKRGGFTLRGDTATIRGPEGRSPLLLPSPTPLHSRHCLPSAKLSSRCAGPGAFQHTADWEKVPIQIWGTEAQEEQRLL